MVTAPAARGKASAANATSGAVSGSIPTLRVRRPSHALMSMSSSAVFVPGSAGEQYGQVVCTRQVGDFLFRESRFEGGLATPSHYHPRAYLCYVADGVIAERDPRGEV